MKLEKAFALQAAANPGSLMFFFGYGYNNAVEVFKVDPKDLKNLEGDWETMTPVFTDPSSLMPRLRYVGALKAAK